MGTVNVHTAPEMLGGIMCGQKLFIGLADQEAVCTESSVNAISLCKPEASNSKYMKFEIISFYNLRINYSVKILTSFVKKSA
jgi:hypothetical protein